MAKVRMNKRSQLTIPKEIVNQLDIKVGDEVEISIDDMGRIVIEPTIAVRGIHTKGYKSRKRMTNLGSVVTRVEKATSSEGLSQQG